MPMQILFVCAPYFSYRRESDFSPCTTQRLFLIHSRPHGIPNGNTSCCLGGKNWIIICVRKIAKGDY